MLTRKCGCAKSLANSRDSKRLDGENFLMISSQMGLLFKWAGRNAGTGCGSVGFNWKSKKTRRIQNQLQMIQTRLDGKCESVKII